MKLLLWTLVAGAVGYGAVYAFVYTCPPLPHF